MNFQEFESNLAQGLQPQKPSRDLSIVIDEKLRGARRQRQFRRRIYVAATGTAVITISLIVLPTVKARATLQRMSGALDNVNQVVMTTYDIGEPAKETMSMKVTYLQGQWKVEDSQGHLTYFTHGINYIFRKDTGRFITQTGRTGPFGNNLSHLGLSAILEQLKGWQPSTQVTLDDTPFEGRTVTRATVDQGPSGGRSIFYADPSSELPIALETYIRAKDRWTLNGITRFDYEAKIDPASLLPDLKRYPPVDEKQVADQEVAHLLNSKLGSTPLKRGRIILRSVDVGQDGTVYVTSQAGEKKPHWDKGYPVSVTDNLGTTYARMAFWTVTDEEVIAHSADGKLELSVFVPVELEPKFRPKTVRVTANLKSNGTLARHLQAMQGNTKGQIFSFYWYDDKSIKTHEVELARIPFVKATRADAPTAARLIAPHPFDEDKGLLEAKALARADYFRTTNEVAKELQALKEALSFHVGPRSNSLAADRLDEIEAKMKHLQP